MPHPQTIRPTSTWICDTCGYTIANPEQGWVEWLSCSDAGKRAGRGLRLVHHFPSSPLRDSAGTGCQYNGQVELHRDGMTVSDVPLLDFLGPQGLMDLLAMIAEDELPKEELLEMIKRLHIPGYEHARHHFAAAIAAGAFEPNTPKGYYQMSDIAATLEYAKERSES